LLGGAADSAAHYFVFEGSEDYEAALDCRLLDICVERAQARSQDEEEIILLTLTRPVPLPINPSEALRRS
jgi:hypothetical protein